MNMRVCKYKKIFGSYINSFHVNELYFLTIGCCCTYIALYLGKVDCSWHMYSLFGKHMNLRNKICETIHISMTSVTNIDIHFTIHELVLSSFHSAGCVSNQYKPSTVWSWLKSMSREERESNDVLIAYVPWHPTPHFNQISLPSICHDCLHVMIKFVKVDLGLHVPIWNQYFYM